MCNAHCTFLLVEDNILSFYLALLRDGRHIINLRFSTYTNTHLVYRIQYTTHGFSGRTILIVFFFLLFHSFVTTSCKLVWLSFFVQHHHLLFCFFSTLFCVVYRQKLDKFGRDVFLCVDYKNNVRVTQYIFDRRLFFAFGSPLLLYTFFWG